MNAKIDDGLTVLMLAVYYYDDPEVIDILLKAGADVNAETEEGVTALKTAKAYGKNPLIVNLLEEASRTPEHDTNAVNILPKHIKIIIMCIHALLDFFSRQFL